MQEIQKKSATLSNEAIKAAIQQTERGKELLAITNQQIALLEKKTRLETSASRSILLDKRTSDLALNSGAYEARRNEIYANTGLTEHAKREKILAATGSEAAMADKIKTDYRENLLLVKETEKQSKMQTALAKENLETLKQTAKENVKAIMTGDLKLVDVIRNASTDEEKLVSKLTQEGVEKEKKQQAKEGGGGPGIMGSLLKVDNLNKFLSAAGQIGQTQNGFDQIGNVSRSAAQIIGSILGAGVGTLIEPGLGTMAGIGIGGQIGNAIGGGAGDLLQRQAIAKQDFFRSRNRYSAITGGDPGSFGDMSDIGVSATQFMQKQSEYAKQRGTSTGSSKTTLDALYAQQGYGIDANTTAGLVELQRSQKENNRDLAALIGGVLLKGQGSYFKNNDSTFLGEFLSKFTILQKEFLKTSSSVSTGGTMDIMGKFNSLGGEWATSDPRSSNLISTVNNSLANPNTDFKKAVSFFALKKDNPNMSQADLIVEQQ